MPLTETGTEIYVATMTTVIYDTCNDLEENLNNLNSLKLKSYAGDNIEYFCAEMLVYAERLQSSRAFKPNQLGYTTRIVEVTSDSRYHIWTIQKYKEFRYLIKIFCVCDMDTVQLEDIITYESLVKEATFE